MPEKLRIPVIIHFGALGGGGGPPRNLRNMNPLTLWEVAKMFPKLKFVIPHFGSGYLRELLQLCWSCPNISIDTSGSNQWMMWMPFELDLKTLFKKMLDTVGPEKILFGTDSSYFPRGFCEIYLQEQLQACHALGLKKENIEKIFYWNAAKMLHIN